MARALIATLAICAAAACGASPPQLSAPAPARHDDGPESWRELTSEHFIVWTNTSEARARTLVQTMEHLRQVVVGISFFNKELKGKSFVIALRDVDEIHRYLPPQFIAHAWSATNLLHQSVIALAAASLDDNRQIVTHELTHVIAFNVIVSQPTWFAEGLAGYFETVRLDEHKGSVDVGMPLENRLRQLYDTGPTPISELFACDRPACEDDRFYDTTWALFAYLLNEHPNELQTYMRRLVQTPAAEQAQLWAQVFAELSPSQLDHVLGEWIHHGKVRILKYTIALRDWPVTERPLSEVDGLAAKAVMRYLNDPKAAPSAELARALALDPTNVLANLIQAAPMKPVAPELARSITAAHPDDWRAWSLAWRAAQTPDEAREAREKTCSLFDAAPVADSIDECARDATGAFAEDPRHKVFMTAMPEINACMRKSTRAELSATMTVDLDIDDSGSVTAARVTIGSQETNTCVAEVMQKLTFPAHHAATYHVSAMGPAAKPKAP